MNLHDAINTAEAHGDFYLYYKKRQGNGATYLVGTTDFDNHYIRNKHQSGRAGLSAEVSLQDHVRNAAAINSILVFSWTNDKFRLLDAKEIRRLTPLSAELRNGRNG